MSTPHNCVDAYSKRWPQYAFAVKTGAEVLVPRGAIQISTFLKDLQNLIFIGEAAGHYLGDYEMIDVVTDSVEKAKQATKSREKGGFARRDALVESKPDKQAKGYKLQHFKNLPGLRAFYEAFPHSEWYILLDDDS
ncbi:hypothetical protein BC830DRAFT_1175637, partial [Chytriomyces sp. MP71]